MNSLKVFALLLLSTCLSLPVFADDVPGFSTYKKSDFSSALMKRKKEKDDMPYRQVVSFYPVKALSNYMMVGYERQVSPKHAMKVVAGYINFEQNNTSTNFDFEVKDFSGVRFDLMFKYFVGKNNPVFNGVYFSPILSFKNSKFKYNSFDNFGIEEWEEGAASSVTAGFLFGYQMPLGESFTADIYLGDALKKSSGNYLQANRIFDQYSNSIGLIGGISIGFGF